MLLALLAASACGTTISETALNPTPPYARQHAPDVAEDAISKLRTRAGQIGCDAIVVAPVGKVSAGHAPDQLSATCVVYQAPLEAKRVE